MSKMCKHCSGSKWIIKEKDGIRSAVRCDCFYNKTGADPLLIANIPERYRHCKLESFDVLHQSLKIAKLAAEKFIDSYPDVGYGLMFLGPPGVGKTHLAVAIIMELIVNCGANCYFQDFGELLQKIKDSYNPISQKTEFQVLSPVLNKDVVILDDLGAGRSTDWVRDILSNIINTRYNENKLTIITSNYLDDPHQDSDSLSDRIGSRMRSRLFEMCKLFLLNGEDFRMQVKQAQYRGN